VDVRQRIDGIRRIWSANGLSRMESATLEAMAFAFGDPEDFNASRSSTDTVDELAKPGDVHRVAKIRTEYAAARLGSRPT
jgi:hypothetical protein